MALWNDKRTPPGVVTDTRTGQSGQVGRHKSQTPSWQGRTDPEPTVEQSQGLRKPMPSSQQPLTQSQRMELLYPTSKYGAPGSKAPTPAGGVKPTRSPGMPAAPVKSPREAAATAKEVKRLTRTKPITKRVMPR